jgi:leucyl aminopeptidase
MLAKLNQSTSPLSAARLHGHSHVLFVLPPNIATGFPAADVLQALLKRRGMKIGELAKTPLSGNLAHGTAASWVALAPDKTPFELQTIMRKAIAPLLAEGAEKIAIAVVGDAKQRAQAAELAVYAAWLNGVALPERKKKPSRKPLKQIDLYGYQARDSFAQARALTEGNTLCRELTMLPPNELTPKNYRARVAQLAKQNRWKREEYDFNKLKRMGAGAFCAVAQGSSFDKTGNGGDAAIVHLQYRAPKAKHTVALVGKGICFDTGGHNLKPPRYMYSMHEDMNGSAVALGILLAATRLKLNVNLDAWLAMAQNHISPAAYKQNDVVTALNGTTIEIMHTDAEGRMVLADTLTLASRAKPDLILDFATLTGSMHTALGDRYSGVFATSEALAQQAVAAGKTSGERVCVFPQDDDYDSALDSAVADVKQCTLEGGGDHILATRLLKRFTNDRPWIHMDLSGSSCKGGLGAVASDVTGFGVAWGVTLMQDRE